MVCLQTCADFVWSWHVIWCPKKPSLMYPPRLSPWRFGRWVNVRSVYLWRCMYVRPYVWYIHVGAMTYFYCCNCRCVYVCLLFYPLSLAYEIWFISYMFFHVSRSIWNIMSKRDDIWFVLLLAVRMWRSQVEQGACCGPWGSVSDFISLCAYVCMYVGMCVHISRQWNRVLAAVLGEAWVSL